ncbi:hypothetical protein VTN02DRAFT_6158 [Thermoascus thermophilus]
MMTSFGHYPLLECSQSVSQSYFGFYNSILHILAHLLCLICFFLFFFSPPDTSVMICRHRSDRALRMVDLALSRPSSFDTAVLYSRSIQPFYMGCLHPYTPHVRDRVNMRYVPYREPNGISASNPRREIPCPWPPGIRRVALLPRRPLHQNHPESVPGSQSRMPSSTVRVDIDASSPGSEVSTRLIITLCARAYHFSRCLVYCASESLPLVGDRRPTTALLTASCICWH